MGYERFVQSLGPSFYAPLDAVDFDGSVEDTASYDISEPSDAELVFAGGIKNQEESLRITTPIDFSLVVGSVSSASIALSVPPNISQNIITLDDATFTVQSDGTLASVTINSYTSPSFAVNQWFHLVLSGTSWTVLDLNLIGSALLVQHAALYGYVLNAEQIADLGTVAAESRIVREAASNENVLLTDNSATATATEWHILSR